MRRIVFFLIGFFALYLVSVIALNLLPKRTPQAQDTTTPQIQIQQPDEQATPSAQEEIIQPDL